MADLIKLIRVLIRSSEGQSPHKDLCAGDRVGYCYEQ
jgi:hypothetical protein